MTRDSGGPRLVHIPKYIISDPWLQGWQGAEVGRPPRGCGCVALGAQFRGVLAAGFGSPLCRPPLLLYFSACSALCLPWGQSQLPQARGGGLPPGRGVDFPCLTGRVTGL